MSYSEDFRKRAIAYLEEGHTYQDTAKTFNISPNTLNTWVQQYRTTGGLSRKKREYKSKLGSAELAAFVTANPDAYQSEISEHFDCSVSTVCRRLKRLGFTRKKRVRGIKSKTP